MPATLDTSRGGGPDGPARRERLTQAIEHAGHLLPAQGPITVFVHHNTLHAFEELRFDEALRQGGRIYGCQPYLSEDRYREALSRGRIRLSDLDAVLRADLGVAADDPIPPNVTRLQLRRAMLEHPLRTGTAHELRWLAAQTDALRRFRPDVADPVRLDMIADTRHWILRDVRAAERRPSTGDWHELDRTVRSRLDDLFHRFGETSIERWSPEVWEADRAGCRDGPSAALAAAAVCRS